MIDNKLRIKELSELEKNWDGYGADPIPSEVIKRSYQFLNYFENIANDFYIYPTAADSIQFEIDKENIQIEILVELDNYHIFIFNPENTVINPQDYINSIHRDVGTLEEVKGELKEFI